MSGAAFELVQRVGVHGPFDRMIARRSAPEGLARLAVVDQLRGQPSPTQVAELARAARLVAGASHPGLQRIHGAGRSGDTAWIMTEIIPGETLQFLLERGRLAGWAAPPVHIAAELVAQAAEAVGALHARGGAHGRLDAAHVLLDYQGRARVIDAVPAALDHGVGDPDARHDVHALAQLFEFIVGGGQLGRVDMGRFAAIVAQAMALSPSDRPPDGRALAAGLRKALGSPVKAGALATWIRDACPDRIEVWREVRTVVRGAQIPPRTLRRLARLLAPETSGVPETARAPDYRSPPTAPEVAPVRLGPSTAPPGAGPPVPPPDLPAEEEIEATLDAAFEGPASAERREPQPFSALERGLASKIPPPLVPPRVTQPIPTPGEEDPTRLVAAPGRGLPERPAGRSPSTDEPTHEVPADSLDDSLDLLDSLEYDPPRGPEPSSSQDPTRQMGAPGPGRRPDSGEFTHLLLAERPPEATPRPRPMPPPRGRAAPRGLPPDGYAPELWGDPVPPRPPPAPDLESILGDLVSGRPSGDRQSGLVVEVARVVAGVVAQSQVLHRGEAWPRGEPVVRHRGESIHLCVPQGATGRRFHLGASETVPEGPCALPLEAGDRAEISWAGAVWRVRVDHAARDAGRATGRRQPWGVWLGALAAGAVLHGLFALGVISLDAAGVQLTVEAPPPAERFARLDEARPLPEAAPPKQKPKPRPPKPRPAPRPEAVDPAEATPALPPAVRQRVRRQLDRTRRKAKDDAEALLAAVDGPKDAPPGREDVTLKDVARNLDAVGAAGPSAALALPGVAAPLPGEDLNLGQERAPVAPTGGPRIGREIGRLGEKRAKGAGAVRGKVTQLTSRTQVSSCSLSKGEVRATVDRSQGKIVGCYEKALLRDGSLSGKITVEWRIRPDGQGHGAKIQSSSLGDPAVAECVIGVIRGLRFPKPPDGGECVIAYPFIFSPSQ